MEGKESDGPQATSISALRSRFDRPEASPKPTTPKYGGGGTLNVFAAGPGDIKPSTANKILRDPQSPTSTIPNGTAERTSKLNIPAAFQQKSENTPDKPQTAAKPFRKSSTSDDNNNPNTMTSVEPGKVAGIRGISGKFDGKTDGKISPRGGNVSAIAGELFKDKSPLDLKSNLRKVSDSKLNFENKTIDKPVSTTPKQLDFRKNLHHIENKLAENVVSKPWQKPASLTRKSDGKKFKKVDKFSVVKPLGKGPDKPDKLDIEIDFENLALDFNKCVEAVVSGQVVNGGVVEEEEEEYDDVVALRENHARPVSERVVSLIPEMTDEEEAEWNQAGFPGLPDPNDLPPPPDFGQEEYDDVAIKPIVEEPEELYEPLPDEVDLPPAPGEEPPALGPKPQPPPVTHIHKKEEDGVSEGSQASDGTETPAERKKREKAEKEAKAKKEKELKKKEKELAKLLKDYKITAEQLAQSVSKGCVKATQKAIHKLDIAVTEGDKVDIIRMTDNLKGRWLIRLDNTGKVGYCDSNNIEVDTGIIKTVMTEKMGTQKVSQTSPVMQEEYEDVDGKVAPPEEEEEVYEVCN